MRVGRPNDTNLSNRSLVGGTKSRALGREAGNGSSHHLTGSAEKRKVVHLCPIHQMTSHQTFFTSSVVFLCHQIRSPEVFFIEYGYFPAFFDTTVPGPTFYSHFIISLSPYRTRLTPGVEIWIAIVDCAAPRRRKGEVKTIRGSQKPRRVPSRTRDALFSTLRCSVDAWRSVRSESTRKRNAENPFLKYILSPPRPPSCRRNLRAKSSGNRRCRRRPT